MSAPAPRVGARRLAVVLWGAMALLLVLFLGVVVALPGPAVAASLPPRGVFFWLAGLTCLAGFPLSRLLPRRISARQAGGRPEYVALTRLVVGWSVCEAVAMFPLVTFLMTRDGSLLFFFALDLLLLLSYFPSANRWAELSVPQIGARGLV